MSMPNAEYMRQWRRENPIKDREIQRRYRDKRTPKDLYSRCKGSAKQRGLEFSLTFEDFMQFWQKNCYYCNSPISTIGLDRVKNKLGYIADNIVPCCTLCNRMKHILGADVFIRQCQMISAFNGA